MLRKYRLMRGYTEKEFAKKIGVSQGYISAIEKGHKLPSVDKYISICRVLKICPNKLLENDFGCSDNCKLTCRHE